MSKSQKHRQRIAWLKGSIFFFFFLQLLGKCESMFVRQNKKKNKQTKRNVTPLVTMRVSASLSSHLRHHFTCFRFVQPPTVFFC